MEAAADQNRYLPVTPTQSINDQKFPENTGQLLVDCPYLEQLSMIEFSRIAQQLSADEMIALGSVLKNIEELAAFVIGVAEVERSGNKQQIIGTEAHKWFEALNFELTKPSQRLEIIPEYFSTRGVRRSRRSRGSRSVDLMVTLSGQPLLGVDLKTGRPWSSRERQGVMDAIGASVIQMGPFVP